MQGLIRPVCIAAGILLCVPGFSSADDEWWSNEHKLYNALLGGKHPKNIRPIKNPNNTVLVGFGKTLLEIEDLDIQTQMLSLHGWLKMSWMNDFLTWNPDDYGGLTTMRLPITEMWRPDIMLYNR